MSLNAINSSRQPPESVNSAADLPDVHRRHWIKGLASASALSAMGGAGLSACGGGQSGVAPAATSTWMPTRTVIVILENSSFQDLIGNADLSWLKSLADASALMTRSYAASTPYGIIPAGGPFGVSPPTPFVHPLPSRGSQTNYFYQFSGHNQGFYPDWFQSPGSGRLGTAYADQYGNTLPAAISDTEIGLSNEMPPHYLAGARRVFTTPNLGAAIIQAGHSYATFSESLPHPYFDDKSFNPPGVADGYARRHNPGINWINFPTLNVTVPAGLQRFLLPVSSNLGLSATIDPTGKAWPGFALDQDGKALAYDSLPRVSVVVPNNMNNRHTGSKSACDAWLRNWIQPYADWARANDALLILTTDEDGFTDGSNGMATAGVDGANRAANPAVTGSYMYGMDRITTLFHGPANRIRPGQYGTRIDHLTVLATVLKMYGALDSFRLDFQTRHGASSDPVRLQEVQNQMAALMAFDAFLL